VAMTATIDHDPHLTRRRRNAPISIVNVMIGAILEGRGAVSGRASWASRASG
jgi:hypothetical protein